MDDLDKLRHTLGRGLLRARTRKGYTQTEAAALVGLAAAVYGRVERGGMLPSVPTLYRLCTVLGVSANVLLGFNSEAEVVLSTQEESTAESEDSPEMRRLASALRKLSPSALRTMTALAAAIRK